MIGVFDSGLGGLSAFLTLARALPRTDLVYYADTAHLPLGEKSEKEICSLVRDGVRFLARKGASHVLLACGTASAIALPKCKEMFAFPVCGIIEAGCNAAFSASETGRIAVIATPATVASHAYALGIRALRPDAHVTELACPALVAAAEMCDTSCVRRVLAPLSACDADTLILGCTHFPILRKAIEEMFPAMRLIDPAALAANETVLLLGTKAPCEGGTRALFTTGDPCLFARRAEAAFGCRLPVEAV